MATQGVENRSTSADRLHRRNRRRRSIQYEVFSIQEFVPPYCILIPAYFPGMCAPIWLGSCLTSRGNHKFDDSSKIHREDGLCPSGAIPFREKRARERKTEGLSLTESENFSRMRPAGSVARRDEHSNGEILIPPDGIRLHLAADIAPVADILKFLRRELDAMELREHLL